MLPGSVAKHHLLLTGWVGRKTPCLPTVLLLRAEGREQAEEDCSSLECSSSCLQGVSSTAGLGFQEEDDLNSKLEIT